MDIRDQEFFDTIDQSGVKYILRCLLCNAHFDANFNNGYNTHYSIRCARTIPTCPICFNSADKLIGEAEENFRNGIDNDEQD